MDRLGLSISDAIVTSRRELKSKREILFHGDGLPDKYRLSSRLGCHLSHPLAHDGERKWIPRLAADVADQPRIKPLSPVDAGGPGLRPSFQRLKTPTGAVPLFASFARALPSGHGMGFRFTNRKENPGFRCCFCTQVCLTYTSSVLRKVVTVVLDRNKWPGVGSTASRTHYETGEEIFCQRFRGVLSRP